MQHMVISGFGHDRPGIVSALTGTLLAHDCNIEDTSMTILGGEFAVILVASSPETTRLADLQQSLDALHQQLGFTAVVKSVTQHKAAAKPPGTLYLMRVSGTDRTGITHQATQLLAERQLSITDLQAHRIEGADGAAYLLLVEFILSDENMRPDLQAALTALNRTLGVESHLTPVDTEVL